GSPLVLTHKIKLVPSGSGSGSCGCDADFTSLRERLESLEREVSDLRGKCGETGGNCCTSESKGRLGTLPNCCDQGRCVDGKCVCFPGYSGPDCSESGCPRSCKDHGRCVNGECVCDPGFSGPDCSQKACPDNCSNRGKCVNGKCVCNAGSTGPSCSEESCPKNCNRRGRCVNGQCVCNTGFTGPDCSKRGCPGNCNNRGRCVNGKCVCDSGSTGRDCSEVTCPGNCNNRGRCVNGKCICDSGSTGPDCSEVTCPGNCNNRGRCVNGKCICDSGSTGPDCSEVTCPGNCNNRGRCVDGKCVCDSGSTGHDCSEVSCPGNCNNRGRCVNGKCVCHDGFTGKDCQERACPNDCNDRGRCVDGKCVCDNGFTGTDCTEIACPGNCNNRGRCVNGQCVCDNGFTGADCSEKTCPDNCSNRGTCVDGRCVCESGFSGDDCSEYACPENCKNRGRCIDGQCVCNEGFTGEDCSEKGCPNNCNNLGRCVNGKCICDVPFTGPDCSIRGCPNDCSNKGRCIKGQCVCRRGFTGPDCSQCKEGMTGPNCNIGKTLKSRFWCEKTRNSTKLHVNIPCVKRKLTKRFNVLILLYPNNQVAKTVAKLQKTAFKFQHTDKFLPLKASWLLSCTSKVLLRSSIGAMVRCIKKTILDISGSCLDVSMVEQLFLLFTTFPKDIERLISRSLKIMKTLENDEGLAAVKQKSIKLKIVKKNDEKMLMSSIISHRAMVGVSQLGVQDITDSSATLIWTQPAVQYETYHITFTSQGPSGKGNNLKLETDENNNVTGNIKEDNPYNLAQVIIQIEMTSQPRHSCDTGQDPRIERNFNANSNKMTSQYERGERGHQKAIVNSVPVSTGGHQWERVSHVDGSQTTFTQTGLAAGQEYIVTIVGEINGRRGVESTAEFMTLISGPTNLQVVKTTSTSAVVQWEESQADIDRYRLTITPKDGAGRSQEMTIEAGQNSAHIQQLEAGRLYDILLVAEKGVVRSQPATTQVVPDEQTPSTTEDLTMQVTQAPGQDLGSKSRDSKPVVSKVVARNDTRPKTRRPMVTKAGMFRPNATRVLPGGRRFFPDSKHKNPVVLKKSESKEIDETKADVQIIRESVADHSEEILSSERSGNQSPAVIPGNDFESSSPPSEPNSESSSEELLYTGSKRQPDADMAKAENNTNSVSSEPAGNIRSQEKKCMNKIKVTHFRLPLKNRGNGCGEDGISLRENALSSSKEEMPPNQEKGLDLPQDSLHKLITETFDELNITTISVHLARPLNLSADAEMVRKQILKGFPSLLTTSSLTAKSSYLSPTKTSSPDAKPISSPTDLTSSSHLSVLSPSSKEPSVSLPSPSAPSTNLDDLGLNGSNELDSTSDSASTEGDPKLGSIRRLYPNFDLLRNKSHQNVKAPTHSPPHFSHSLIKETNNVSSSPSLSASRKTPSLERNRPVKDGNGKRDGISRNVTSESINPDTDTLKQQMLPTELLKNSTSHSGESVPSDPVPETEENLNTQRFTHGLQTNQPHEQVNGILRQNVLMHEQKTSEDKQTKESDNGDDILIKLEAPIDSDVEERHDTDRDIGVTNQSSISVKPVTLPKRQPTSRTVVDQHHGSQSIDGIQKKEFPKTNPSVNTIFDTETEGTKGLASEVSSSGGEREPLNFVDVTNQTSDGFTVIWDSPEGKYKNFVISRTEVDKDESQKQVLPGSARSHQFEHLPPQTEYTITLLGKGPGILSSLHKLVISTGPEPPSNIMFSKVTENSMTVSWTKPKSSVDGFKVTYTHADEGEPVSVGVGSRDSTLDLAQLSPGSSYEVTVISTLGLDESDPIKDTVMTLPDPPTDLQAVNVTDSSALLLWRPALATVDKYTIVYGSGTGSEVRVTISGNAAEQQLSGLEGSTTYTVTVRSQLGNLESSPATTSFTTKSGSGRDQNEPQDLKVNSVTPRSAVVSWIPLSKPVDKYILVYRIKGESPQEIIVGSDLTQYKLTRLHPGSLYTVELRPIRGGQLVAGSNTEFTTGTLKFPFPADCSQELLNGVVTSDVVEIFPQGKLGKSMNVSCDMETDGGGWTVFQRRKDGSVEFYNGWKDYVSGFGNLSGEFWLGLEKIHNLTKMTKMNLRVDLRDGSEQVFAKYSTFEVSNRNYKLSVGGYSGTAGDSLSYHNNCVFSTKDRDPAPWLTRCAISYQAGWWYKNCHEANLNGRYGIDYKHQGLIWKSWKGEYHSIQFTEMKMRPASFRPPASRTKNRA
uniref:Tenascin XB n=1 Tax=Poecilia formosa TaxID=48698 RepID=A0A087XFZ6_POEFO